MAGHFGPPAGRGCRHGEPTAESGPAGIMRTTAERSLETGVTTVRLTGDLTRTTMTTVRSAIAKAAAECPTAVVVDLSGLGRKGPVPLSVFASATYQSLVAWGVPVLLCGASPDIHRELRAFRSFIALYDDHWRAVTAVRAYVPRWMRRHLAPVPASAAAARVLLGEACSAWNLDHLRETARLVASELAANAIRHADTDFDVTVSFTGRYLRIAVHDGSVARPRLTETPHAESGRGLQIVRAVSTHWGTVRVRGGKIVWALLRAQPAA
jgi:anti-anti-sigma regulatory factor